MQFVELGKPVHQLAHRGAKTLDQLNLGHATVFERIVQQGRHQGLHIELPVGALGRHCDRMRDVGFAAVAQLPEMGLVGKPIGQADLFEIGGAEVIEFGRQTGKTGGRSVVAGRIGGSECAALGAGGRGLREGLAAVATH